MQKIDLFSGYDTATLFDKIRRQATGEIGQWPEAYFIPDQLGTRLAEITDRYCPCLPEIDWTRGKESINEKIYPLSSFQPGAKRGASVRVNLLNYEYPYKGEIYLLGSHPTGLAPESPGTWFADPASQIIVIEYTGFNKSPRQVFNTHKTYLSSLINCYSQLKSEFATFGQEFPGFLHEQAEKRRKGMEERIRILSALQNGIGMGAGNQKSI